MFEGVFCFVIEPESVTGGKCMTAADAMVLALEKGSGPTQAMEALTIDGGAPNVPDGFKPNLHPWPMGCRRLRSSV